MFVLLCKSGKERIETDGVLEERSSDIPTMQKASECHVVTCTDRGVRILIAGLLGSNFVFVCW